MATSSKTPTASGISRLLSAAGFERSESSTTRIRGWHNHSEGFSVTTDYVVGVGDCISVSYNRGRCRRARQTASGPANWPAMPRPSPVRATRRKLPGIA